MASALLIGALGLALDLEEEGDLEGAVRALQEANDKVENSTQTPPFLEQ